MERQSLVGQHEHYGEFFLLKGIYVEIVLHSEIVSSLKKRCWVVEMYAT